MVILKQIGLKMRLSVRGLRKSFGNKEILKGVDLDVVDGEVLCITGPNGAGKTTLIKILSTLLRPDEGEIVMEGEDPFKNPRPFRRRIGVLSHDPMLYRQLTARENLRYVSRIYGIENGDEKVEGWLKRVGLIHFADERVGDFSEGMRQRLAVARAMIHSPDLLLLDEPFASLDRDGVEMLIELIRDHLSRGGSAVVTSHMNWLLERITPNPLSLSGGKLEGRIG